MEIVLPYDHTVTAQERAWDCCPASVQVALNSRGVIRSEDQLIRDIGTNENGTNTVEQALPILNQLLPEAKYVAQWMPNDPPRPDQVEALWHNVKNSIDAGYPCVLNFEVPHSNFPVGTRGSSSPEYRGSKIWHYVCCAGYADDGPGGRHFWIADPGFRPFGYWMSVQQAGSAIPPHAYAYASVAAPSPKTQPQTQPVVVVQPKDDDVWHRWWTEWSALEADDDDAIRQLVRDAAAGDRRARHVLRKVDQNELKVVLTDLEQKEPDVLQRFIS